MFSPVWVMALRIAWDTVCAEGEEVSLVMLIGSTGTRGASLSSSTGKETTGSIATLLGEGDESGRSRNAAVDVIFCTKCLNVELRATKSVSHLSSTIAALVPMTVTPINPSFATLPPTFSAFFAPEISRSFSNHSNAASIEWEEAESASFALERETGLRLRSSAMREMGTFCEGVLNEGKEVERYRDEEVAGCMYRRKVGIRSDMARYMGTDYADRI